MPRKDRPARQSAKNPYQNRHDGADAATREKSQRILGFYGGGA